jgi:tripartite-type tricarboxylate transporter receptor subunit TctC
MIHVRKIGILAVAGFALGVAADARADAVSDFYTGKRVTMLIGLSTGGGYDRYARLTARYLGEYIPGKPTFIPRNMTGGGSLVMANYLYNAAPQDGSIIGAPQRGVPVEPLVAGSASKAKLDPLKMHWIGSLARETSLGVAWHTSGVKSYQDLYNKEFIAGGTGATTDSVVTGYILNRLLGMKFRMIAGYPGGSEVNLAMQRGEVMGRATNSWSSIKSGDYTRVKEGKLILLYQMGAKKNNDDILKDVPFALDFAKDKRTRQILFLKFGVNEFGYPYVMGPGVPKERVAAVREAFKKVTKDPGLLADARKARMEIDPIYGDEIETLLKEMYSTPADIVAALRDASVPTGKVEMAKIPVITASVKLRKVTGEGRKVSFKGTAKDGSGVKGSVGISGSKTRVSVGGKPAKRNALKAGMACTLVYQGRDAKEINCK